MTSSRHRRHRRTSPHLQRKPPPTSCMTHNEYRPISFLRRTGLGFVKETSDGCATDDPETDDLDVGPIGHLSLDLDIWPTRRKGPDHCLARPFTNPRPRRRHGRTVVNTRRKRYRRRVRTRRLYLLCPLSSLMQQTSCASPLLMPHRATTTTLLSPAPPPSPRFSPVLLGSFPLFSLVFFPCHFFPTSPS